MLIQFSLEMNIEPVQYNRLNFFQFNSGLELIKHIHNCPQISEDCDQYILDIGSGDGKLTAQLDKHFNRSIQVYGVDLDEKMIGFAQQNYSGINNNIQYFQQDFGVKWNQLRPELKAIEGKVVVIFSNWVLQWIYWNRQNVAYNMSRLMKKDARVYLNFFCCPKENITPDINITYTELFEQMNSVPTVLMQKRNWLNAFRSVDINLVQDSLKQYCTILNYEQLDQINKLIIWPFCQLFIKSEEEKEKIFNLLHEDDGKHLEKYNYNLEYFQFILQSNHSE